MTKLWLLFATLAFSCLFLIYRPDGNVTFILSGLTAPMDTAAYFFYEHVAVLIFAWIIYDLAGRGYLFLWFLVLCAVDMVLFLLYYKSPTFIGIPWNALKCVLFGVPLLYETWKHYFRR